MKKISIILVALLLMSGSVMAQNQYKNLSKKESKALLKNLGERFRAEGVFWMSPPDTNGNFVVSSEYLRGQKYGVMNLAGEVKVPLEYDYIQSIGYGLFYLEKDSMGSVFNKDFVCTVAPYPTEDWPVDEISFYHGYYFLGSKDKIFHIDTLGRPAFSIEKDDPIYPTSVPNRVYFINKNEYRLCDTLGNTLAVFAHANSDFTEGVAEARDTHSLKYGYIDADGKWVIQPQYRWAGPFIKGLAEVSNEEGNSGLIDHSGRLAVAYKYSDLWRFDSGRSIGRAAGEYYLIDSNGAETKLKGRPGYSVNPAAPLSLSQDIVWSNDSHDTTVITDLQGNEKLVADDILIDDEDYYDPYYHTHVFPICKDRKFGLIDRQCHLVTPMKYAYARMCKDDYGIVYSKDGKLTVIDTKHGNKKLLSGYYDWVEPWGTGLFWVGIGEDGGCFGLVDKYGNTTFSKEDQKKFKANRESCKDVLDNWISWIYGGDETEVIAPIDGIPVDTVATVSIEDDSNLDEVFVVVEEDPVFPGGMDSLYAFLGKNIQYPAKAKEDKIEGRVFVSFIIEKDGSISTIRLLRDIGGGCGDEAVRVVKMMPKWTPGMQRGQAVRVLFNLPLTFELDDEEKDSSK